MADEPDYVTVLPHAKDPYRACVAVMRYHAHSDSYDIHKCSEAMKVKEAEALAESWAAALKVEIR